jgi:hypothetical protein
MREQEIVEHAQKGEFISHNGAFATLHTSESIKSNSVNTTSKLKIYFILLRLFRPVRLSSVRLIEIKIGLTLEN